MKHFRIILVCFFLLKTISGFAQLDTAAFRETPGDFLCCTFDSTELFKDTIVFCKGVEWQSPFILDWEKRCQPINDAPYLFFQPDNDSVIFVYEVNVKDTSEGVNFLIADPRIVRGTWKYGKNKKTVEANFPAWKTDLIWKVQDHPDYWLFIRKKGK
jgi:hypothetical protein